MIMRGCKRTITGGLCVLAGFLLSGCAGTAVDHGDQGPAPPSWLEGLPERTVTAAPGEMVWAVVPELGSEAAAIRTYRLAAVTGAEAVLVDTIGNRYQGVPGALVHPASGFPEAELTVGTAVLADRWDAGKIVGRVARLEAGQVELDYDWNGVTVTGATDAVLVLPAGEGSLVLRWVGYRTPGVGTSAPGPWYKGLCFAESGEKVWISTDGGHVEVVAVGAVKPLADIGRAELAQGDAVAAYSWGHGYRRGVIEEVLEPGLRYTVKLEGGQTRPVFFDSLTAEPTWGSFLAPGGVAPRTDHGL